MFNVPNIIKSLYKRLEKVRKEEKYIIKEIEHLKDISSDK